MARSAKRHPKQAVPKSQRFAFEGTVEGWATWFLSLASDDDPRKAEVAVAVARMPFAPHDVRERPFTVPANGMDFSCHPDRRLAFGAAA